MFPPAAVEPEILGYGDGVATIFSLSFENFITGTLTVFIAPAPSAASPAVFVAQASNTYTIGAPTSAGVQTAATNQVVTFNPAPIPGSIVAARYQATAFSDYDLQSYLSRAQMRYTTDETVLQAVQYALIDVILMDQRRMEMIGQGDFRRDRNAYMASLRALQAKLFRDLQGGPVQGSTSPAISFGNQVTGRYFPHR